MEDGHTVCRVARGLWRHRETLTDYGQPHEAQAQRDRLLELLVRIEGDNALPRTDALDCFKRDETLEELVAAIERDIHANKPAAALDRLHTYCMKKFGHLLDERQIVWERAEPLQSRVGKYVRALEQEREIREITRRIIKASIGVFDQLNDVRNNKSFAHDNELVEPAEARFIFEAVSAFLRFLKSVDQARYGA